MKNLHPIALGGLLLNAGFILLLTELMPAMNELPLTPEEQEIVAHIPSVIPTLWIYIAVQAAGLFLISKEYSFGFAVALFGTLVMFPISLVYGFGCSLSYYALKNKGLPSLTVPFSKAERVFPSSFVFPLLVCGGVLFAGGFFVFSSNGNPMGVGLMAFGILNVCLSYRAKMVPPLALYDTFLVVSPYFFGKPVAIPYTSLRTATLLPKKMLELLFEHEGAPQRVVFSFKLLVPQEQKAALEALAGVLRAHEVELK